MLNRFEVEWMIREANVNDYIDIHKICCQDLGYNCNADLVKERLKIWMQAEKGFLLP